MTERRLADCVEDHVVGQPVSREVLPGVVDHPVRAQRAGKFDVAGVAHGRDLGAEVLEDLHRRGAVEPEDPYTRTRWSALTRVHRTRVRARMNPSDTAAASSNDTSGA